MAGAGAAGSGAASEAGASAFGSVDLSASLLASVAAAGSASPPSDEVHNVRLSRRSCMMSVLSR